MFSFANITPALKWVSVSVTQITREGPNIEVLTQCLMAITF